MTICRCCGQPVARLTDIPYDRAERFPEMMAAASHMQAPSAHAAPVQAAKSATTLHVDQDVHDCLNAAYDLADQAGASEVGLPALILAMARFAPLGGVLTSFGLCPEALAESGRIALAEAARGTREQMGLRTGDDVRALLARCREMVDRRGGGRIGIGDVLTALTSLDGRQWSGNLIAGSRAARTTATPAESGPSARRQTNETNAGHADLRLRVTVPARSASSTDPIAHREAATAGDARRAASSIHQTAVHAGERFTGETRHGTGASSATVLPLHRNGGAEREPVAPVPRTIDDRALRTLERAMSGLRSDLAAMTERLDRAERTAQSEARRAATLERDLRARMDRERRDVASLATIEARLTDLESASRFVVESADSGRISTSGSRSERSGGTRHLDRFRSHRTRRTSRALRRLRQRLRQSRGGSGVEHERAHLLPELDLEVAEDRIERTPVLREEHQVAAPAVREAEIEDDDDVATGDRPKRFYLSLDDDIVDAPSIGQRTAERLLPAGVRTVRDLLQARPARVAEATTARHITPERVRIWQQQARLVCTVPWLRGTHAQLLVGAGYTSAQMIAEADLDAMMAAILRFAGTRDGQSVLRAGPPPSIEKVIAWSEYAALAEMDRAA